MKVFRGFHHPDLAPACALTIGNFDGVHRGHQAMLALLRSEAAHRGVPSCVMTFEPHPRDYFAKALNKPDLAPARIATLRDKLQELERCGVDQVVVLPNSLKAALIVYLIRTRRIGIALPRVARPTIDRCPVRDAGVPACLDSHAASIRAKPMIISRAAIAGWRPG